MKNLKSKETEKKTQKPKTKKPKIEVFIPKMGLRPDQRGLKSREKKSKKYLKK